VLICVNPRLNLTQTGAWHEIIIELIPRVDMITNQQRRKITAVDEENVQGEDIVVCPITQFVIASEAKQSPFSSLRLTRREVYPERSRRTPRNDGCLCLIRSRNSNGPGKTLKTNRPSRQGRQDKTSIIPSNNASIVTYYGVIENRPAPPISEILSCA
jgi:hypothetical protein